MPRIYNTLSRKIEEFKPQKKDLVKMYCCGPTVYWYQHIGNFRTYVNEDVLRRVLEHEGLRVKHVMNITDVGHLTSDADSGEDKMDLAAKREHKSPEDIAGFYEKEFFDDSEKLNIKKPEIVCRATGHIKQMIGLIKKLEKNGCTYNTGEGVFFDTAKFKNYAKFAKLDLGGQRAGARKEVVVDKGKKRPWDFALWFTNKPGHIMQWDSPWGKGFPGWHIECSAMSLHYAGPTLDIHCGGIDHVPVHHTNEIAQSECATGKNFSNYWVHNWHLLFAEKKVSKSAGHSTTPTELEKKGHNPLALRLLFLNAHYRSNLVYSEKLLQDSGKALERLQNFVGRMLELAGEKGKQSSEMEKIVENAKKEFFGALYNDLNSPKAMQKLFGFVGKANALADKGKMGGKPAAAVLGFLKEANKVVAVLDFGEKKLVVPKNVKVLLLEREKARKKKDWKKADYIRQEIRELGFTITDTPTGPKTRKAN